MYVELVDGDGVATVLRLSSTANQIRSVRFLLGATKVELHASFDGSSTALDVVLHDPDATPHDSHVNKEVVIESGEAPLSSTPQSSAPPIDSSKKQKGSHDETEEERLRKMRGWLMVVAVTIVSVTYQASLNPPGGVWQDDNDGHNAGLTILAHTDRVSFTAFQLCNNAALAQSLFIIMMLLKKTVFLVRGKFSIQALRVLLVGSLLTLAMASNYGSYAWFGLGLINVSVLGMLIGHFLLAELLLWIRYGSDILRRKKAIDCMPVFKKIARLWGRYNKWILNLSRITTVVGAVIINAIYIATCDKHDWPPFPWADALFVNLLVACILLWFIGHRTLREIL